MGKQSRRERHIYMAIQEGMGIGMDWNLGRTVKS